VAGEATFRRFDRARDRDAIVALLAGSEWPFRLQPRLSTDEAARTVDAGNYDPPASLTLVLAVGEDTVGMVRAEGIDTEGGDPQLDFRIATAWQARGLGLAAARRITDEVFASDPARRRIEAQTRADNVAMRRVLRRAGYVLEAVYREAWPAGERWLDGVGYAILRRDWEQGTTTPVRWEDV
jgi:RimJ/RimL family protein N-acetyltransferase